MELATALEHVKAHRNGVLVTHRRDGRAQLSNIVYVVSDDGTIQVSITADRAKAKNLARDSRCEFYVSGEGAYQYLVLDAECELSAVASSPDDAATDELVELYRQLAGEHENWDEYRAAMVKDQRLVARITPSRAVGIWSD